MREIRLDTPAGQLAGLRFGDGRGTPVLALHGWLDNAASFVPVAPYLPGIDLVALDLPGHGASAHLPESAEYTMIAAARSVLAAADALGWSRFVLLGHSMGAAIATLVAAAAPARIARMVVIEALGGLVEAEDRTAQRLREAFAADARPPGSRRRLFSDIETAVAARLQAGGLSADAARLIVTRGLAIETSQDDAQRRVDTDDAGDTRADSASQPSSTRAANPDPTTRWSWSSDPRLTRPTAIRMTEAQLRDLLGAIDCPVRLVHAEPAFRYFPADVREARVACLRDVQVTGIDGGHHLHMEQPEVVAAAIAGFLSDG